MTGAPRGDEWWRKKPLPATLIPHISKIAHSGQLMKVGRNQRCPCGSGKKFKRCHMSDQGIWDRWVHRAR